MGYRSDVAFCLSVNQFRVEGGEWEYDKAKFKEMVGFFKLTKFYEEAMLSIQEHLHTEVQT